MKKDSRKYNRWKMGTVCNCLIYYPVSGILDFYFLYYTFRRIIQNTD